MLPSIQKLEALHRLYIAVSCIANCFECFEGSAAVLLLQCPGFSQSPVCVCVCVMFVSLSLCFMPGARPF